MKHLMHIFLILCTCTSIVRAELHGADILIAVENKSKFNIRVEAFYEQIYDQWAKYGEIMLGWQVHIKKDIWGKVVVDKFTKLPEATRTRLPLHDKQYVGPIIVESGTTAYFEQFLIPSSGWREFNKGNLEFYFEKKQPTQKLTPEEQRMVDRKITAISLVQRGGDSCGGVYSGRQVLVLSAPNCVLSEHVRGGKQEYVNTPTTPPKNHVVYILVDDSAKFSMQVDMGEFTKSYHKTQKDGSPVLFPYPGAPKTLEFNEQGQLIDSEGTAISGYKKPSHELVIWSDPIGYDRFYAAAKELFEQEEEAQPAKGEQQAEQQKKLIQAAQNQASDLVKELDKIKKGSDLPNVLQKKIDEFYTKHTDIKGAEASIKQVQDKVKSVAQQASLRADAEGLIDTQLSKLEANRPIEINLAQKLDEFKKTYGENDPLYKKFQARFAQAEKTAKAKAAKAQQIADQTRTNKLTQLTKQLNQVKPGQMPSDDLLKDIDTFEETYGAKAAAELVKLKDAKIEAAAPAEEEEEVSEEPEPVEEETTEEEVTEEESVEEE